MKRAKPIRQAIETTRGAAALAMDRERHSFSGIELHIDELVLHGFLPADRHRIQDALESELARLMVGHGAPEWPKEAMTIEQLAGGSFKVARDAPAQTVGKQVARALCGSFDALRSARPKAARETPQTAGRAKQHEGSSQ